MNLIDEEKQKIIEDMQMEFIKKMKNNGLNEPQMLGAVTEVYASVIIAYATRMTTKKYREFLVNAEIAWLTEKIKEALKYYEEKKKGLANA